MKFLAYFFIFLIAVSPAIAQIELVGDNFFPAEFEFEELRSVVSEIRIDDASDLADIENGGLITDVGFDRYIRRSYALGNTRILSIEVVSLLDARAAYSLLTLLRKSEIRKGPPGDAFTSSPGIFLFCNGRRWVRIRGSEASQSLMLRIATSVSNRIGPPEMKQPALISLLPENGLDLATLRYFPGTKAFVSYHQNTVSLPILSDMEIAQARVSVNSRPGMITLLKFPTHEIAEEYFNRLSGNDSFGKGTRLYFRRIGPLLALLDGSFSADKADGILAHIQYSYTVQWIYDKNSRSTTIWGIPVAILGSTVLAFFIVVLACSLAILAGIGLAACRLLLRQLFPRNPLDNPKRTEITRLKLP